MKGGQMNVRRKSIPAREIVNVKALRRRHIQEI